MKKLLLSAVFSLLCAISTKAQDCKLCGVWNGTVKEEYPSGDQYRVKMEFTIESPRKFEIYRKAGSGWGSYTKSSDFFFVDDECTENRIKFYTKENDDNWGNEKFKGKRIGYCVVLSYYVLEVGEEENTLILRSLGNDSSYYDIYGNYIGKEWSDCDAISCVCVLHQLED